MSIPARGPEGRSVVRTVKGFFLAVTVVSVPCLLLGIGTLRAQPDKSDPHRPVPATDVVLVKKITLKGGRPPGAGGGNRKARTATGLLGEPCGGTKYAIVVGISNYPGTLNDLEYAAKDAEDMTRVLATVYGFSNITTLENENATRDAILSAIETLSGEVGPEDEVVFFFSGHGMNGVADDGDTERNDVAIAARDYLRILPIWDGELRQAFSGFATSRIIFIFDCCFAGGMDVLEEPGRVILMASGERGYAYEGDEWYNGEFTYYLIEGIQDGQAGVYDYDRDGVLAEPAQVTAEEAFDYARAHCDADKPVIADSFPGDLLP